MLKNWLFLSISEYYKTLSGSVAFRVACVVAQFVAVLAVFAALYALLLLGWSVGLPM